MAGGAFNYAAFVWNCDVVGLRVDTAELQRRSNAVVRQACWSQNLPEGQLYTAVEYGGYGCVNCAHGARQPRISLAVRMLNSSSLAAVVLRLEIASVANRARYEDGVNDA